MANSEYRIYPDWKDTLVYDEGDGRTLRLDCDCVEPYQVSVPTADMWLAKTPPWAHERRSITLDRLRAAKCVICEVSGTTSTIHSPDGTFRVEVYFELDDRGYPLQAIRVISADGMNLELNGASLAGQVRFPSAGLLTLPFNFRGQPYQVGVNIPDRTFWFHPTDEPQPMDRLLPILAAQAPAATPRPIPRPRLRSLIGSIGLTFASLLFVAAGVWQIVAGKTAHDRWIGVLCVLFFGLCAAAPIIDVRKWMARRQGNQIAPPQEDAER